MTRISPCVGICTPPLKSCTEWHTRPFLRRSRVLKGFERKRNSRVLQSLNPFSYQTPLTRPPVSETPFSSGVPFTRPPLLIGLRKDFWHWDA
jgi:hypothetical protein